MILEVCVDSITSLMTAKEAGADRIELCGPLSIGGITPSYGLLKEASKIKNIDIVVMVRPRGGDFLYDHAEIDIMKNDIDVIKEIGFEGIVVGILKSNGRIDFDQMKEFVERAKPMKTTLHRAFDDAKLEDGDIDKIIDLGICRILTSGQRDKAVNGLEFIKNIQEVYGDKIEIMPGCGLNHTNIELIYKETNCNIFHMSGKVNVGSKMEYKDYIDRMNTPDSETILEMADYQSINEARKVIDGLCK